MKFLIIFILLFFVGCCLDLSIGCCGYCGGNITKTLKKTTFMRNVYEAKYLTENGIKYHCWCKKIMTLEKIMLNRKKEKP